MPRSLFTSLVCLMFSFSAHAAEVLSLFDSNSMRVGALLAFRVSGVAATDVRRYELEGATDAECRVSRDNYYPEIFQVKCVSEKSNLRLKLTLFTNGQMAAVYSTPFNVLPVATGVVEIKASSAGGL